MCWAFQRGIAASPTRLHRQEQQFVSSPTFVEISPLPHLFLLLDSSSAASLKAALEKATGSGQLDSSSTHLRQSGDDDGSGGSAGSGDATQPTASPSGTDSVKVTTTSAETRVGGRSEKKGVAVRDDRVSEGAVKSTSDGTSEESGEGGRGRGLGWSRWAASTSEMFLQAREQLSEMAASWTWADVMENAVCFGRLVLAPYRRARYV